MLCESETATRSEVRQKEIEYFTAFRLNDPAIGYGFRGQGLFVSPSRDLVVAFFGTESQSQVRYARALARSGLFKD